MEKALKKSSAEAPTSALQTGEPKRRGVKDALEWVMHLIFMLCGIIAVAFVLFISIYLIISGVPAIREIGLVDFLFGQEWSPTASDPSFGILPFILTSVYGTAGAILIGVPIGLMTAVFLAKVANPKVAAVIHTAVELLAGIPSVVYGLVGMILLVPGIQRAFDLSSGACLLAAILVLAIMILPSIISVSETSLRAVPEEYEQASLALGPPIWRRCSGCPSRRPAAAWPRPSSWAWAVPSARPWPSSWWRATWPTCLACSPRFGSSPPPSLRRCPTPLWEASTGTHCSPSAWCSSCSSC